MAGPNGSHAKRGGPPPQWPTESDEQARALEIERWHQRQAQQQRGYPPPQPQQPYLPGGAYSQRAYNPGYRQQGFARPPHGKYDPAGHGNFGHGQPEFGEPPPMHRPDHPQAPEAFAPPFDRFAPPPGHGHEPHAPYMAPQQAEYDPQSQPPGAEHRGGFDPYRQPPPFDMRPDPGLQQGHHPAHGYDHDGRPLDGRGDPQSWDFSQYQPGQIPHGYATLNPFQEPAPQSLGQPTWPPQHGHGHGHAPQEPPWHASPQHDHGQWSQAAHGHPHAQGVPPFEAGAPAHFAQHLQEPGFDSLGDMHDAEMEGEEFDAPEERRRGPSTIQVVGMLLGAIVVGGGLAFAYKQFSGTTGHKAALAELKKPTTPEKVRPKEPGGKTVEHSDKTFLNRLAADAPTEPQRQSDIESGARKVSTIPIVVNRDGSLTPQAPASGESGVPGLVLDGLGPPPVPASAPQLRSAHGPVTVPAAPAPRIPPPPPPAASASHTPPVAPRIADLPLPKVLPPPAATAAVVTPAAPPKKQRAAVRDDYVAPRVANAAASGDQPSGLGSSVATPARRPVAAPSSSGYVAVLASKKSRQEALNSFADLHSQYPDVLGGLTPDVREANLGDKGMWYRLIVGPPGSREAARTVCGKLKEKGMTDCWPVAY